MIHVKSLFESRPWYNLIPDQTHTVVTAGYGTFSSAGALGDSDYLTAARTPDGALVMAYMPTSRTMTVDMSTFAAPVSARWYDPSNGMFSAIAGSPFDNAGTRDFTPTGPNSDGDGDWVLVLEAASIPADTQAPSQPGGLHVTGVADAQISFAWAASTDDVAVAGYQIFRDGVFLRTTPSTAFTDIGLAPLTSYSYTVVAVDYFNHLSLASAALVAATTSPGPTFVQAGAATPQTPQSAVNVAFANAQAAGDTNILAIGWNDTAADIVSVSDSAGNVYQRAIATYRGNALSQAIYFAANIAGAAPGSNFVTVTFTQAAAFVDVRITEYSGLNRTNPFDGGVSASASGSSATTATLTTSTPSELLFAAGMTSATFTAPGAGFTSRMVTTPDGDLVEDAVASVVGSYSAGAAVSGGTWVLQLAVFAPAS